MKFMQNTNYQEAVKIFPDREVTYIEAFDFFLVIVKKMH